MCSSVKHLRSDSEKLPGSETQLSWALKLKQLSHMLKSENIFKYFP